MNTTLTNTLDLSPLASLAIASLLPVIYFIFKIFSASRSPLHALPGPKRGSLLLGNVPEAAVISSSERNYPEEWTDAYSSVVRVHGLLGTKPELVVSDPEFLHFAYVSDHDLWPKPRALNYFTSIMVGPGVLGIHGSAHKRQRKLLNPMFSVAHMRALTPAMYSIAIKLSQKMSGLIASQGKNTAVLDILNLASATALDIIGSAGLGYDFDALGTENAYAQAIKHLSPAVGEMTLVVPFLEPLSYLGPYSFRSWVMDTFCPLLGGFGRSVLKFRRVLQTMDDNSRKVYRDRQAAIAHEDALETQGPAQFSKTDVLSNLVRAASKDSDAVLEEKEAVANINTMVFGGFETTSNAISHTVDVLASHQDLQDRLRSEILKSREETTTEDYDTVMGLPLLDAVVRESLRLHPPIPVLTRESTVDMVVPFALPVKSADGKTELTEIFVPKETTIHVSVSGLNRSEAIWGEDAKEFKPERWLKPEGPIDAASKPAFERIPTVFSSLMTFSAGPKGCIGWRMAVLEIKIVLSVLLQRFRFQHKSDAEIKWIYSTFTFPQVVGDEATGPKLPLIVSEIAN